MLQSGPREVKWIEKNMANLRGILERLPKKRVLCRFHRNALCPEIGVEVVGKKAHMLDLKINSGFTFYCILYQITGFLSYD